MVLFDSRAWNQLPKHSKHLFQGPPKNIPPNHWGSPSLASFACSSALPRSSARRWPWGRPTVRLAQRVEPVFFQVSFCFVFCFVFFVLFCVFFVFFFGFRWLRIVFRVWSLQETLVWCVDGFLSSYCGNSPRQTLRKDAMIFSSELVTSC